MGLLYLKDEEKQLYSAYGLTVYGRQDRYEWTIYNNKPDENVYTSLRIERNGEEIYNRNLGNRCIFEENFNRTTRVGSTIMCNTVQGKKPVIVTSIIVSDIPPREGKIKTVVADSGSILIR